MKIIFLDIDGVLNNSSHTELLIKLLGREQYLSIIHETHEIPFDYRSIEVLKNLISETNAEIVLSSTWRLNPKGIEIIEKYTGLKIKDKTPRLNGNRGEEIQEYLNKHKEISNYVIIDDDNDMLPEQLKHFVQINSILGFGFSDYITCRNILNNIKDNKEFDD